MLNQVDISASIKDHPVYSQYVQDANRFLAQALDEEEKPTRVRWEINNGSLSNPIFLVSLADPNEEALSSLVTNNFKDPDRLKGLMYHLYGKLLGIRSKKLIREIRESIKKGATE